MRPEEAEHLAKRVINTFRLTPAITEWRDALAPLDQVRATIAFTRCRDTVDGGLSIKRFLDEYRHTATRRHRVEGCTRCGDTGHIDVLDDRRHRPGCTHDSRCHCHAVERCPCQTTGIAVRDLRDEYGYDTTTEMHLTDPRARAAFAAGYAEALAERDGATPARTDTAPRYDDEALFS